MLSVTRSNRTRRWVLGTRRQDVRFGRSLFYASRRGASILRTSQLQEQPPNEEPNNSRRNNAYNRPPSLIHVLMPCLALADEKGPERKDDPQKTVNKKPP